MLPLTCVLSRRERISPGTASVICGRVNPSSVGSGDNQATNKIVYSTEYSEEPKFET